MRFDKMDLSTFPSVLLVQIINKYLDINDFKNLRLVSTSLHKKLEQEFVKKTSIHLKKIMSGQYLLDEKATQCDKCFSISLKNHLISLFQ